MSLPNIVKDGMSTIPYNPGIVSNNPQLAYTLSFNEHPISHSSVHFHPRDSYQSPLSQYQFADFDDSTYDHLLQQTINNYRSKNASVIKGIRSSFKEFYARISMLTYQSVLKFNSMNAPKTDKKFEVSKEDLDFRIEGIKGNLPIKWPEGLNEFQREINKLPWNAFSTESFIFLEEIISQIKTSTTSCTKKLKTIHENQRAQLIDRLSQQCQVLITISLKTLSQKFLLQQILFIQKLFEQSQINIEEERNICEKLALVLKTYLKSIPNELEQQSKYHCNENFWDLNSFLLMKKVHFQKSVGLTFFSATTDGKYLYIYVSSMNGGMYKFGTGNNGTIAGQLYYERSVNLAVGAKADDVSWVYLKGKLYLKSATKDPSNIDVYSPEDFKKVGSVQLACKSLFGHNVLVTLNRSSVLMTDGENLYFLGKRIKIVENNQLTKPKTEQKKEEAQQNDKTSKKQKKKKKNENQQNQPQQPQTQDTGDQSIKFVEFVLAKFNVEGKIEDEQSQPVDEQAIQDIFESFSGYFNRQECKRAYRLNHYDVMQACQWLFDEGSKQKQKSIKILPVINTVVLCESEINNNFNEKTFKNITEIVTKQGSLLHIQNVTESIWTMDQDEVACYSENGIKIFSKRPILSEDEHKKAQKLQNSTLISRKDRKHPRNPKYTMIHDPYNKLFYTFCWRSDSNYFPCPVFISKDSKEEIELSFKKRLSVDTSSPEKVSQIARFYLSELSLLEIRDDKNFGFNDHVWWYGQKIKKLNTQHNSANTDEKKKISNKKSKIMTKLNKINEMTKTYQQNMDEFIKKGKITKEIIKLYPFDSDGSIENLIQILQSFKNIQNCPNNKLIGSFLVVIQKWLKNSSQLASKEIEEKMKQVLSILRKIFSGPSTSSLNKEQVIKTILRHFEKFYKTRQETVQFLISLQPHDIKNFLTIFNSQKSYSLRESIIYELTKKDLIITKYDSKHNFSDIFKETSESKVQDKNMISLVLMRKEKQISAMHASILQFIENTITTIDSQLYIEFFLTLFTQTFKQINCMKNTQEMIACQCNLFEDSLKILEKCLSASNVQKTIELVPVISFIVQVYYASVIRLLANQSIIKSLLKIVDLIQKPELVEFNSYVKNLEFEGVSAIQERIYETSHPLERGKSQTFPNAYFPESSFLFLEFDKRCQSDQNHDIMTIQLLQDENPIGNSIPCLDDIFSTHMRLTGKVDLKKPILMLGNSVSIDFNSSGHAKDAQSFGRFGFKFGLRPINAGKITYQKNVDMKKLQKTFKSENNFKSYINTLKFLVVAVSTTLQSLYTLEEDECSSTIKQLLKGKIIRQGLQEGKKAHSQANHQVIINKFLQKNYQDPEKEILKSLNIGLISKLEKKSSIPTQNVERNLWNIDGVPSYIKSYIEEIKKFNGGFIEVFKQARVHAPPQGSYSHELRRPGFTPELRQLWLQGEALLFLTVLKHSGLLHLNLKFSIEYIKQNLKAFEQARNGIFYAFISRMQTVREWRDLVQTYHGKHEQESKKQGGTKQEKKPQTQQKKQIYIRKNNRVIRTVQFPNKESTKTSTVPKRGTTAEKQAKKSKQQLEQQRIRQIEKQIRERLNNEFLIQQICTLKKLQFIPNNIHENVTNILEEIKNTDVQNFEFKQSVYVEPINHLIQGCLFLLTCKSPSTRESLEQDNDIVPVGLGRSLSSDNKHADTNKVELFREWLQNWKKWKGFKKENKIELKFPVLQIVEFINSWIDIHEIKNAIQKRTKMCQHRIDYYKHLSVLLKSTSQCILISKYAFGSEMNIGESYRQELESAPMMKLEKLNAAYNDYAACIKDIEGKFMKQEGYAEFVKMITVNNVSGNKKVLLNTTKQQSKQVVYNHKQFLDRLRIDAELIFMIESENPNINLDLALYFINFKFLSNQCEEVVFLSGLIVRRALIIEHKLGDVLDKIKKEVGNNNLTAKRWKDLLFIERILFLLRKLEQLVRKKSLEIDEKQRVAETLFYLMNLTQVPVIHKVGLKILKKLKDVNFNNINTLFNNRYKQVKLDQNNKALIGQYFSVENCLNENNIELLSKKSLTVFKSNYVSNEVQTKLLALTSNDQATKIQPNQTEQQKENIQQQSLSKQAYNIILNLHQEEDLCWFLRVLYYIEELERQSGKGSINEIKDWKEYLEMKNNKQSKKNEQQQQQNAQLQQQQQQQNKLAGKTLQKDELNKERILSFIPNKITSIDPELEDELPFGWYMSYGNVFKEFSVPKTQSKTRQQSPSKAQKHKPQYAQNNQPQNPSNKKAWQQTIFLKITKKFDQFNGKPLEEPKQTDSQQVKAEFIKAKNLITRIRKHLSQILGLINQFTNSGYVVFRQDLPKQKALEICHLISLGGENKLKPIKVDFSKDDYKNRIVIEDIIATCSKIKITLIQSENYPAFEELLALEASVHIPSESSISSYVQINKKQYILDDAAYLPFEDYLPIDFSSDRKQPEFCKEFIQSQIFKMKKRQEEVYLPDYPKLKYFISQGGIETGLKNVTLVPASEHSLTIQSVSLQDVLATSSITQSPEDQEPTDFPEQVIQKLLQILSDKLNTSKQINSEEQIMDHLLFSFYLKKLSKMNLKFVSKELLKNLGNSLVKFNQGIKSYQPIEHYESEMQKLLIKFIDYKQPNLRIFEVFNSGDYEISPTIAGYISKQELNEKKSEINSNMKQDIASHHFPKSSYLLKTQAPQVEQNKLLKYWQKNILPKIYEFVKTTLRPLQIDDFFEQMRMPLRKNDQMQAKKIAYVICDNKLPQGAVLPDSNHNWNSFSLEDIQIGQHALVKLPKHTLETISPLLMTGAQEYRLVKIVFIDIKAPSVLVRYRIDEYSIMGYLWVPINSLVRVEKQLMHLSPQLLYTEIEKNVKGMIYGYSKLCLTQLTSVSDLDQTKLIKETIADLFIHDPISGWLSKPQHEWSMRHVLKTMVEKGDMQIVDFLEKQFCPIQSFETDLFTDQVTKLDRFQNAKALIVSFKKTAGISLTSGVKFYKDPYLFNEIMHVYTTKNEKTQFEPLIFNDPNVFCKYYTNKECLKPSDLNKYNPKSINVTVFGVNEIWTIGCYLGEVISQIAEQLPGISSLETLRRLNRLYLKWILQKKVAVLCSELSKLVSRITNRITAIQEKNNIKTTPQSLGIDQVMTKDLLAWIKMLLQEEEKTPLALYSEILQNLSQMAAVMLRKSAQFVKPQTLPQHIDAMINLMNVLLRIDEHLRGVKITQKPEPLGQWQRFLLINKIPEYVEKKDLIKQIKQIINRNKGKILTPKYDIFSKDDKLLVCVQGWNITELVEEQIVQKIEKQEEEEKQQEQQQGLLMMEWQCSVCTYVNPMGNSHCEMCGTQMPPAPAAKQVYEEVQATDVSKAENKLKELESKRFETIKQEIGKFLHIYWENTTKKIQKRNKELQELKNKPAIKKKDQEKQDLQPKPLPQKPDISLLTGSDILNDEIIESFLEFRWLGFKQSVKKLVENEKSYLSKFKKLETLGYDLWCDNIFHENPTLIPFERLYQLMNYIQGEICKGSSSVLSYSENSIRLLSTIPLLDSDDEPINYQVENNIGVKIKYKNLAEIKSYNIRYSWKVVKELNVAASKCLQFINMNLKHEEQESQEIKSSDCLGWKIKLFRNLIMGAIKLQLTQKIIQKTSVLREPQEVPKIQVQRLKVRQQRGKDYRPVSLKEKEDFLFTKAHEQFSKVSPAMLRPFKPKGTDPYLSFSITFKGEMAMGEAGPYRQFFTDVSTQLDPKNHMGLFIPTPNNKHGSGEAKSKWTINPKANSSYHLSLFEFLGLLMGCCIRTGTHLALDLPKIFWKLLVSQKPTDSDIEQTDFQLLQTLKMLKEIPSEQMFHQLQQYTEPISWTFKTSDQEEHEIIHNGKNVRVTFEDREKYIAEVKKKRVNEAALQINRVKKGLQEMMPESYFNTITGDELKLMICGRPIVDVDLLRKHTKYAGGLTQQENRIKYFWQVMREIDQSDKLKVIKFCWGQQRLPINSEQFERNNIRFMIKPMMNEKVSDQSLPKADTCFFNIELPNYSTKQVMKQKILLAINMDCVSINADQNFIHDDNPLMNQIEHDDMYEGQQGENEW